MLWRLWFPYCQHVLAILWRLWFLYCQRALAMLWFSYLKEDPLFIILRPAEEIPVYLQLALSPICLFFTYLKAWTCFINVKQIFPRLCPVLSRTARDCPCGDLASRTLAITQAHSLCQSWNPWHFIWFCHWPVLSYLATVLLRFGCVMVVGGWDSEGEAHCRIKTLSYWFFFQRHHAKMLQWCDPRQGLPQ